MGINLEIAEDRLSTLTDIQALMIADDYRLSWAYVANQDWREMVEALHALALIRIDSRWAAFYKLCNTLDLPYSSEIILAVSEDDPEGGLESIDTLYSPSQWPELIAHCKRVGADGRSLSLVIMAEFPNDYDGSVEDREIILDVTPDYIDPLAAKLLGGM